MELLWKGSILSLVVDVKQMLMIVLESSVRMEEPAKMQSMLSHVIVQMALLETDVKQMLMIVQESFVTIVEPVLMESVTAPAYVHVTSVEWIVKLDSPMVILIV